MLAIVQAPNPVLGTPAKKIAKVDQTVKDLITQMSETLVHTTDPEGVGLAAPQVGKSLQLFIAKPTEESPILTFINPQLTILSKMVAPVEQSKKTAKAKAKSGVDKGVQLEGCLSLYNIWGVVKRAEKVRLMYLDENGKEHDEEFSGFLATIIQHEVDHLNGILFPRRVLEQKNKLYKSVKDEDGETVFEEIKL